jgi:hypothetical protein
MYQFGVFATTTATKSIDVSAGAPFVYLSSASQLQPGEVVGIYLTMFTRTA